MYAGAADVGEHLCGTNSAEDLAALRLDELIGDWVSEVTI